MPSMIACLVNHSPGSCCHCHETRIDGMSASAQVKGMKWIKIISTTGGIDNE